MKLQSQVPDRNGRIICDGDLIRVNYIRMWDRSPQEEFYRVRYIEETQEFHPCYLDGRCHTEIGDAYHSITPANSSLFTVIDESDVQE